MDNYEIEQGLRAYYDKRAPEYDEWYERRGRYNNPATNSAWHSDVADLNRNLTRLAATVSHNSTARVLDLACGTGKWTPIFARALQMEGRVVAFDYSMTMLKLAEERLLEEDPDGALLAKTWFVQGDAYNLPFKSNTFDIVFMGFWLGHVLPDHVSSFMAEVRRVLKPAGQVFVVDSSQEPKVPNEEIVQARLNDGSVYPVFKIRYSLSALQTLLEQTFGSGSASAKPTRTHFIIGVARNK